ncbi:MULTISPECIES: hypothetical protein [Bacillus]|uniref:Uncharacterized protein n=2 Tax=Bacillus subtilis TaxID=1423 RepID=A0AAQ3ILP4_BACIU|nr:MULTISPECIES: hypothetical protein [Bacillus]KIN36730.1 hypothetical protein B4071_2054 [Bacillus subtilis]KYC94896.1 hypothetical protein B425_1806 [Bacillus amyloliquefaciens]MBO3767353.1 hypothetical protein [Bacillus subtilis]MDP8528754.1 hypothetical protein [Bacillus subtilis]MEC0323756.1 hypothetical protein [Bacillus subtilis]
MGIKAAVFEIKATCYAHEGFNDESPSVQGAALEQLGKDIVDNLLENGVDDVKIKGDYVEELEVEKPSMKYFEVCDPYYALIKANTKEKAIKLYTEEVADDDGYLRDEIKEVGMLYAAVKHSRTVTEDQELSPISDVLEELQSNEERVLIMDGSLL